MVESSGEHYPGLQPMAEAPRDREITAVLGDYEEGTDPRVRVQYDFSVFDGRPVWFDANGDGAPDSPPWRTWDTEEFAGWLP